MDTTTAHKLNTFNQRFYARNAASFSSTRSSAWQGWERLRPEIERASAILDVACGNMRFEKYAAGLADGKCPEFYCVDSCAELAVSLPRVHFQQLDVVKLCIERDELAEAMYAPICDLSVSFGFLHHIPGFEARSHFVDALLSKTAAGGAVALSFWCFMNDGRLARKALAITEVAKEKLNVELEQNDYFLGWQNDREALRYCHSFTDEEIGELVDSVSDSCALEQRYDADGRSAALNSYVILRKR